MSCALNLHKHGEVFLIFVYFSTSLDSPVMLGKIENH